MYFKFGLTDCDYPDCDYHADLQAIPKVVTIVTGSDDDGTREELVTQVVDCV